MTTSSMSSDKGTFWRVITYLSIFFIIGMASVISVMSIRTDQIKEKSIAKDQLSEIINISGRQRMLSQLLIKLKLADVLKVEEIHQEKYDSIVELFINSQNKLKNSAFNGQVTDSLFNVIEPYFDSIIYYANAEARSRDNLDSLYFHAAAFLPIMDQITDEFELNAKEEFRSIVNVVDELKNSGALAVAIAGSSVFIITLITLLYYTRKLYKTQKEIKKIAEDAESKASKLEFLTNSIKVGIWEKSVAEGTEKWNKELFDILGKDSDEINGTGQEFYQLVHPDDRTILDDGLNKLIKLEEPVTVELRVSMPDGKYKWVEATGNVKKNKLKKIQLLIAAVIDINERKKAEIRLNKARKDAVHTSKVKSEFLSTMSHEIRTPLNGIIGLTGLLLRNQPRKDQKTDLELLKFSGENLLAIVNDILDFNKIESGKLTLESINFNLNKLLKSIVDMHQLKVKEKGLALNFNYDSNLPKAFIGDPVRISQVINNLVNNAIKFTPDGSVKLEAVVKEQIGERVVLEIIVSDTGIGIRPENKDKIFRRFEQEETSTTRVYGGTGLGLSICLRLAELMDGKLSLDSAESQGSTFRFELELPLGEESFELERPSIDVNNINLGSYNLKVLVAEDNHINYKVLQNVLVKWGIASDNAKDGQEAIEMAISNEYDLIFMDLQMPVMDGYQSAQEIAKTKNKAPIIALSASVLDSFKKKAKAAGMNEYITKPIIPDHLLDVIIRQLNLDTDNLVQTIKDDYAYGVIKGSIEQLFSGKESEQAEFRELVISELQKFFNEFKAALIGFDSTESSRVTHKNLPTLLLFQMDNVLEVVDRSKMFFKNEFNQEELNELLHSLEVEEGKIMEALNAIVF